MTDLTAAWFMTTMSGSKVMTALVQTASALPAFLLAPPGGVLVDLVDRRRWLLASQPWIVASVSLLAGADGLHRVALAGRPAGVGVLRWR
jgi:MFS family permease